MSRKIFYMIAAAVMLSLASGCAGGADREGEEGVLSFEQAKEQEPSLMSTDEIVSRVKSDTTHKKVVYWFDVLCKPCRYHLQHEIAKFYADHDTAEWRVYLVAGLNGLHHAVPDAEGNMVEDPAGDIGHFAKEYREWLPSLGFDMKDVYMHYDPVMEERKAYEEMYPDGFFTAVANGMFYSDVAFRCQHDGVPKFFVADRTGRLLTDYYVLINKERDTLDSFYAPNEDYLFDIADFSHHDTAVGVMMKVNFQFSLFTYLSF